MFTPLERTKTWNTDGSQRLSSVGDRRLEISRSRVRQNVVERCNCYRLATVAVVDSYLMLRLCGSFLL
jgi:hypothetical protein